jgi:hypothetical protein
VARKSAAARTTGGTAAQSVAQAQNGAGDAVWKEF